MTSGIIGNKVFWGYLALYLICLVYLGNTEDYRLEEAIGVFVIFGLALPTVAYWISRRATPLAPVRESMANEMEVIGILLALVIAFLSIGPKSISVLMSITENSPRLYALSILGQKLILFVVIPLLIYTRRFRFTARDFGLQWNMRIWYEKRHVSILMGLSLLLVIFQYFVGQAAAPIREGEYSIGQLASGLPIAFAWLLIDVGLVEEFFFRVIIQSRIAVKLKSEISGVLIAALLFGLAHAPGLILRGAGVDSPVGSDPSVLFAVSYSVVVLSAAGIFLGIVWSLTRNLLLVIMIHAAVDLLPNYAEFAKVWGL